MNNLIGSSFTKEQIISYLPDYNSKCVFTYIAVALWLKNNKLLYYDVDNKIWRCIMKAHKYWSIGQ